jgi:hypothetical protein
LGAPVSPATRLRARAVHGSRFWGGGLSAELPRLGVEGDNVWYWRSVHATFYTSMDLKVGGLGGLGFGFQAPLSIFRFLGGAPDSDDPTPPPEEVLCTSLDPRLVQPQRFGAHPTPSPTPPQFRPGPHPPFPRPHPPSAAAPRPTRLTASGCSCRWRCRRRAWAGAARSSTSCRR